MIEMVAVEQNIANRKRRRERKGKEKEGSLLLVMELFDVAV